MLSTLLEKQGGQGSLSTWIILGVLLVILVVMYVFSFIRRKKYNQEAIAMIDSLKPGDKVKTYSGIYGTIVSIRETTDGKVVTLETGDARHSSYVTVDTSVIYCIDKKQDIVRDSNGDIIEPRDTDDVATDDTIDDALRDEPIEDAPVETETKSKRKYTKRAKPTDSE